MSQIKIINDYRDSKENEFFFRNDPYNIGGVRELFDWLEAQGYSIENIPEWQIQNTNTGTFNNYPHGVRIEKL
jgi:hypothetical protein|tara:strand:- start:156 stop:374 length:219 start_codon:yes stop_codon:yes gene_type:complete